ncbi:hypothetical protein, partial [Salmonella sp. SAL4358]|uniref:hypothetical protein n=1 Tax=Salmonella sp. SAL4358 TaxID=3159879 RepID=UPI00397D77DB
YDQRDRLKEKATPQGTLTYTYDASGNLTSMKSSNANGVHVVYAHDALNRLGTATDQANGARPANGAGPTTYAYDAAGNLAGYTYPNA